MGADEQRIARALARLDAAVTRLEGVAVSAVAVTAETNIETSADEPASTSDLTPLEQRREKAARGLDATIGRLRTLLDGIDGG